MASGFKSQRRRVHMPVDGQLVCPFCGYDDTDSEFGLGTHINRWCEESPPDEEISSKLMSGEGHPMFGKKHSEETKKKMREYANSNNISPPNLEGEENPAKREEVREKISEKVSKAIEERGEPFFDSRKTVKTDSGELVASEWEATVYNALDKMDIEFAYEGIQISYNSRIYFPDFLVKGDYIIEVKGPYIMKPERVKNKARAAVEREEKYIVVGNEDLPCDYHIEYLEDVDSMKNRLSEVINQPHNNRIGRKGKD